MGVYVYTLRKSRPHNTPQGKVYQYKFKDRLQSDWDRYCWSTDKLINPGKTQERMLERLRADFDYMDDCLVTIEGSEEERDVYRQGESEPVWYDCDRIHGDWVGVLRKNGRSWYVSGLEQEVERSTKLLKQYMDDNNIEWIGGEDLMDLVRICWGFFMGKWGNKGKSGTSLVVSKENKQDYDTLSHARHIANKATEIEKTDGHC